MSPDHPIARGDLGPTADQLVREAKAEAVADVLIALEKAEIGEVAIGWRIVVDAAGAHTVMTVQVGEYRPGPSRNAGGRGASGRQGRWVLDTTQTALLERCLRADDELTASGLYVEILRSKRMEAARRLGHVPDDELRGPVRA